MSFPHIHDHYSPYSNPDSPSPDEDENASLRSQALNADGTPKRPMNAFMIFARRRRPQVSAANQMMRTGEISKILSKEWNTMPMSDKQFYLDQAKKLKENFNAKYPDYVYRRRPNNSRKKRRTDPIRGVDAYGVPRDDSLSPHDSPEYHQLSPVDALLSADGVPSLATPSYRMHYPHSAHYYPDASAAAAAAAAAVAATPASAYSYYPSASGHAHPHHTRPASYDGLPASVPFPHAHSPSIYHADDDLLGAGAAAAAAAAAAASAAASFPRLDPVKPDGWGSSAIGAGSSGGGAGAATSALSARRGTLQPPPLRSGTTTTSVSSSGGGGSAHARHWSDGSSPSASGFPTFQTLTAPFYPSSGTVSPSTASSSSVASYFGAGGAERDFEQQPRSTSQSHSHSQRHSPQTHPSQQSQQSPASRSHGHSPSFGGAAQPPPLRQFSGPTLSSTLALSPVGLWSSVRSSSASVTPKSEL